MSEPVLRCQGLVRRFGDRTAVDDVSFEIAAGETYGLLGPNGSGKTTTISMIAGVLAPDAGSVEVLGMSMSTAAAPAKAAIGLVPQSLALYLELTARENLAFFGRLQGLAGRALQARIDEVLDVVGLRDRADEPIDAYSGGMARRANIAVGLLHEPKLLILDEPTVGVDPQSRNQILGSIERLGGAGLAVLYTTHYMEEAERLCQRVGILDRGRMLAEGTRRELVARIGDHDRIVLVTDGDTAALREALGSLDGILEVIERGDGLELSAIDGAAVLAGVVAAADRAEVAVRSIAVREPDLETVFLSLTGRALRD